jgi:hypothetical protein
MAIIFEWDSKKTKKRKYRTVDIHRRLTQIDKEEILLDDVLTDELKIERKELKKELKVIELELNNRWIYEKQNKDE